MRSKRGHFYADTLSWFAIINQASGCRSLGCLIIFARVSHPFHKKAQSSFQEILPWYWHPTIFHPEPGENLL
jgi:hypothetical protein